MAERPRMTAAQLADKLLADEHADVLRESVAWMAAQLMETDVAARIGAELGERTPDRLTHRNGYRPRAWDTRVGQLELAIPKLRQGSYFPSFLETRRRAEQALVAVVQEAYVNGVSTRKVDRLVEQLGLHHLSKDQVSRLCQGLDEQVRVFRERPLEGAYPYLTLLICERGCSSTEASWSWLVRRWWLGVADRAGVKVERPERRVDDDLGAGEGRHRMKQRRGSFGHCSGITSRGLVWSVARGRPALSRCSDQVRRHDG